MRFGVPLLSSLIVFSTACGDPSSTPIDPAEADTGSAGAAGSAGEAGHAQDAAPDAVAGQGGGAGAADAGLDAAAEADPPDDADAADDADATDDGAQGPDACGDVWSPAPPLSVEECDLILADDESTPMEIVTNTAVEDDEFLHQVALPIDPSEAAVQHLIARMRATLAATGSGVGLAAPQVRISRRLFLAERTDQSGSPVQPFLNPLITAYSDESVAGAEGCLSVPGSNVSVTRSRWVTVSYQTFEGDGVCGETIGSLTSSTAAFAARIVQHEYDHLDGFLIVDP